jgi:uncharacterized membrane protein
MMLDHTRDFVHNAVYQFDPTDPARTNVALFFTRWITHFCAPVFVFLAGSGAYLQLARGKSKEELSRFLVTRGLWLIVLEVTVVKVGVFFNFDDRTRGAHSSAVKGHGGVRVADDRVSQPARRLSS